MRIVTLVVAVVPFLWSCGKPVSQVAAKVNGNEIAVGQLRRAVAMSTAAAGETKPTPAQVIDAMIDEELLAQKAVNLKLDRQPQVRASIEAMRTRILAQAYMQHLAAAETEDPHKIKAFYRENPALFRERRIYRLFELAINAPGLDAASLHAKVSSARTLSEVGAWLKSQNIEFTLGAATKAAEEIPMELLPRLASMQDGQIKVIHTASAILVIHLVQSRNAPLSENQAIPLIEQFLRAPELIKLVAAELKKLRNSADIEYVLDLGVPRSQKRADSASVEIGKINSSDSPNGRAIYAR
jgi:EpsD family peptidyl-prolyl cis-trans isomerase